MDLSIIFPAFNEEGNIRRLLQQAFSVASKLVGSFEIIVVDDGSRDKTAAYVKESAREIRQIRLISHRRNLGYGAALKSGLQAARGKYIFFTDADLQFDLRELKKFLAAIDGVDVVIGYRAHRQDHWTRIVNMWGWRLLVGFLLSVWVKDIDCAFKLFRREVIGKITVRSGGATFSAELLYKIKRAGFTWRELPVKHFPRRRGRPTGGNLKVIKRAFDELWRVFLAAPEQVRSRARIATIVAILALFASRLALMSPSADFFDSNQYLWRLALPNFLALVTSGHPPFHPLYLLFCAAFYRMHLSSQLSATLPSAILGAGSVIFLYLTLKMFFSRQLSVWAAALYALLPFVWISQITILVDPTEHFFYFLSLYLLGLAIKREKATGYLMALTAGLSFGLAGFAHTQVALWGLAALSVTILAFKNFSFLEVKRAVFKLVLFAFGGAVFVGAYVPLLTYASRQRADLDFVSWRAALKYLLFGNAGDRRPLSLYESVYRAVTLSTTPIFLLAIFGAFKMLYQEKKKFLAVLIWLLPAFLVATSYNYENLYGRALIIGLVPILVFALWGVSSLPRRWQKVVLAILVIQLLAISSPAVWRYHRMEAANSELARAQKESTPGGVFVSAYSTKTWAAYDGDFFSLGDVGFAAGRAQDKINAALKDGKSAYISSDAVYLPYRRYDGLYFDLRSTGVGDLAEHTTLLSEVFRSKSVFLDRVAPAGYRQFVLKVADEEGTDFYKNVENALERQNVVFGRLTDEGGGVSGAIVNLFDRPACGVLGEDLTRLDLGFCLKRALTRKTQPDNWSFSDKDGWFFTPTELNSPQIVLGFNPLLTHRSEPKADFVALSSLELDGRLQAGYDSAEALKEYLGKIEGPFYVLARRNSQGKPSYRVYSFPLALPTTQKIEGEDFVGERSEVRRERDASGGKVLMARDVGGYFFTGPYVDLSSGTYELSLRMRARSTGDQKIVLDVVSDYARQSHASREFSIGEISADGFKDVKLDFTLQEAAQRVEFRLKVPEKSAVEVDYLELTHKVE